MLVNAQSYSGTMCILQAHVFVVIALLALKIQSWLWRTYQRINFKLGTNVTTIKMSRSLACLFFNDLNLASLLLRISPKFQSHTNVPLHSRSLIIQFLSLLSGWLSSHSVSLISKTFYGLNLTRVSPRIFVREWKNKTLPQSLTTEQGSKAMSFSYFHDWRHPSWPN